MVLVRCPGYCMASCKSCLEDVTSPVCVQSQFSCVSPGSASSTESLSLSLCVGGCRALLQWPLPSLSCLMETMAASEIFPLWNQLCGCLCWERALGVCCASAHSLGGFLLSPWPCCCSGLGSLAGGTYQKPDIPGATHSRTESQSMCSSEWIRWKTV